MKLKLIVLSGLFISVGSLLASEEAVCQARCEQQFEQCVKDAERSDLVQQAMRHGYYLSSCDPIKSECLKKCQKKSAEKKPCSCPHKHDHKNRTDYHSK